MPQLNLFSISTIILYVMISFIFLYLCLLPIISIISLLLQKSQSKEHVLAYVFDYLSNNNHINVLLPFCILYNIIFGLKKSYFCIIWFTSCFISICAHYIKLTLLIDFMALNPIELSGYYFYFGIIFINASFRTAINLSRTIVLVLIRYRPGLLKKLEDTFVSTSPTGPGIIRAAWHLVKTGYNHKINFGNSNNEGGYRAGNLMVGVAGVGTACYGIVKLSESNSLAREANEMAKRHFESTLDTKIAEEKYKLSKITGDEFIQELERIRNKK